MKTPYINNYVKFEPVNHIPNSSYWKKVIASFLNQPKNNVRLKLTPDMSICSTYNALKTTVRRDFKGKVVVYKRRETIYLSKVDEEGEG